MLLWHSSSETGETFVHSSRRRKSTAKNLIWTDASDDLHFLMTLRESNSASAAHLSVSTTSQCKTAWLELLRTKTRRLMDRSDASDHRVHNKTLNRTYVSVFHHLKTFPSVVYCLSSQDSKTEGGGEIKATTLKLKVQIESRASQIKFDILWFVMRPVSNGRALFCASLQHAGLLLHVRDYNSFTYQTDEGLIRGASLLYCPVVRQPSSRCFRWQSLRGKTGNMCVPGARAHTARREDAMGASKLTLWTK